MMLPLLLLTAAVTVPEDRWLVGAWGAGPAECARDSGIRFETDGTYSDLEGEGSWELAGSRLIVSATSGDDFGRSQVVQLGVRNAVEMVLEWPDGTRRTFHRCPKPTDGYRR
jgi:hypothetical protein